MVDARISRGMDGNPGAMRKTLIVAELSANHNGSLRTALETIRAAKRAGADAVKLQTYTADTITLNCARPDFVLHEGGPWDGRVMYELYQEAYTPWEWHAELFEEARRLGLVCFSTPFDSTAVDFLEGLGTPMYKIASFEIADTPLIAYAASKGKPMVLATGIATEDDIARAVKACRDAGNDDITLLKCTSAYPTKPEEANLRMIPDLARRFGVKAGLSDHTLGPWAPVVAVTLGAVMVEKHFIIDRAIGGPDASFSMDEGEFTAMVQAVRTAEAMLGRVDYTLTPGMEAARMGGRSLYVAEDIEAGDAITPQNVRSVRPGFGLPPYYLPKILGMRVVRALRFGDRLALGDIELPEGWEG